MPISNRLDTPRSRWEAVALRLSTTAAQLAALQRSRRSPWGNESCSSKLLLIAAGRDSRTRWRGLATSRQLRPASPSGGGDDQLDRRIGEERPATTSVLPRTVDYFARVLLRFRFPAASVTLLPVSLERSGAGWLTSAT